MCRPSSIGKDRATHPSEACLRRLRKLRNYVLPLVSIADVRSVSDVRLFPLTLVSYFPLVRLPTEQWNMGISIETTVTAFIFVRGVFDFRGGLLLCTVLQEKYGLETSIHYRREQPLYSGTLFGCLPCSCSPYCHPSMLHKLGK